MTVGCSLGPELLSTSITNRNRNRQGKVTGSKDNQRHGTTVREEMSLQCGTGKTEEEWDVCESMDKSHPKNAYFPLLTTRKLRMSCLSAEGHAKTTQMLFRRIPPLTSAGNGGVTHSCIFENCSQSSSRGKSGVGQYISHIAQTTV